MGNGNGSKWQLWFAGTTVTILIFMGSQFIAADQNSRCRDEKLGDRIVISCEKQTEINQQILIALQDIKTEQRVTKELIKNGGAIH